MALLLVGCGDDLLGEEYILRSRAEYCTLLANQQEHGWQSDFYVSCMYGHASAERDGGAD